MLVVMVAGLFASTTNGLAESGDDASPTVRPTVVLLALENNTRDAHAVDLIDPILIDQLAGEPLVLIKGDTLRNLLRARRLRAVGGIGLTGARILREAFGADYVLTGSYDVFAEDARVSEIGLSLRLTDLSTHRVVWARSVGATGRDYETILGLGRIEQIDELAQRLVAEATKGLDRALRNPAPEPNPTGARLAVVPFDDIIVDFPGAGVVSAQVLTQLVNRGFYTIEPGVIRDVFLEFQRLSRGGIDYDVLAALHDSVGVTHVVTGSVDGFHRGVPDLEESFPEVSISGRCLDAASKSIISVAVVSATGGSEVVLGMGNTRAANDLAYATTSSLLDKLDLKNGRRYGNQ